MVATEALECRMLLSAGNKVSAGIDNARLMIHGTNQADDIEIRWLRNDPSTQRILVSVAGQGSFQFARTGVTQILAWGYGGNDRIRNQVNLPITAHGGAGNDTLTGSIQNDRLNGGPGNDILDGGRGNDILTGGLGNDTYIFGPAPSEESDEVIELPGEGIDTLDFSALKTGVQMNLGSAGTQAVHANRKLKLSSGAAIENLFGGTADDKLQGNALNNELRGNGGNDTLTGGRGDDLLIGGSGNDTYVFGPAGTSETDTVVEAVGGGIDTLDFSTIMTPVTLNLGSTAAQAVHTNRTLKLSSGNSLENANGGSAGDRLIGNSLNNRLIGNDGPDWISGNKGDDVLYGNAGDDILRGGDGDDTLYGGSGDDNIDGNEGFDIVHGGSGSDVLVGERVNGNTIPFLPALADVDTVRIHSGITVPLPSHDSDGDVLSYTVETSSDLVSATLNSTGLLIETQSSFIGTSTITVTATDPGGLSYTTNFRYIARNQLPVINSVDNIRRLKTSGTFRIPFEVADADGDSITRSFSSSVTGIGLSIGQTPGGRPELVVTPTHEFTGMAIITMRADDGHGIAERQFEIEVIPSSTKAQLNAPDTAGPDWTYRLDNQGNVYQWKNRTGDLSAILIAENTRSITLGNNGLIFRLGFDGSLNRRDPNGTWFSFTDASPNIAGIHAAAGYLFLIPENGGPLGVMNPNTGAMNPSLITGTVQNEISGGNLHTLDSVGNLYVNGAPHIGPMVFNGPYPLYHAALGRVRELAVTNTDAYYLTFDGAVYRMLGPGTDASVRVASGGVFRIRGLGDTLYMTDRSGYSTYEIYGEITIEGASIGLRERFAADQNSGYVLSNGRLSRIPPGSDETPVFLVDNVAEIIGHAGRLYRVDADGTLYRQGLSTGQELLARDVRKIYEVARRLFVFRRNGQIDTLVNGKLQNIATGVRQFSHSGNFYAGQPWILYEDGRVAEINMTSLVPRVIGGSTARPYNSIAVGDGVLLALQGSLGVIERWNGSSFSGTTSPYSSPGKALQLAEANGIAAALYENQAIVEWNTDRWIITTENYSPTEIVIGIDFVQLAGDQDRMFAIDTSGDIWTIPLHRPGGSNNYGRGDWLEVPRPVNSTNRVFQLVEAGGRIFARQSGTIFQFHDIRDYTDKGDWKAVGGSQYSSGSPYYWDMASAGGELYVRDDYENARIWKYSGTPGVWIDVSGSYRFNRISTSVEGNLVGYRAPDNSPIAFLGDSWEETTLLWRRSRVLTISGRNNANDYVRLGISGNYIVATVNDPNAQQVYNLAPQGTPQLKSFYFLKTEIDSVIFHGLGGNDTLEMDVSWNNFVPVTMYGGAGEDTFTGRFGYDRFYGQGARDTVTWELHLNSLFLSTVVDSIKQSDMIGDRVIVDVVLGSAIRRAFDETHKFITDRLRPVTEFLNSDLVSIKEFNFRITWRQAISKVRGLKELVRLHDELIALSSILSQLPLNNGRVRLGEFDVNGAAFSSVVGNTADPFASFNNLESIRKLNSYGITLPFLQNGRELVKIVMGLPVDLVMINTKLSTWLTDAQLSSSGLKRSAQGIEPKDAISLASGVIALGPIPVQWELKFNYGFDLGIVAGLDTRGLMAGGFSQLRDGLFLQSFSLTAYGKLIGEAGWDAGMISEAMPDLEFIELVAPRAEIVGEIGLAQTYTYTTSSRMYLFNRESTTPSLIVDTTLFGALRIEAELGIRASGWLADYLDAAEEILESATDAYYVVYENVLDLWGTITGQKAKKVRKPESQIKREVRWEFNYLICDFSRTRRSVFKL